MRADDLNLDELLEYQPKGGVIRFAGQRALLFDAVALGLLRKELVETLGAHAARALFTRFGYAHGWRTAETLKTELPWDSERDWRVAGGRLHRLQGLVVFEPLPGGEGSPFAEAIWHESYEAEQHLLHLGQSEEPVCWTLAGFASGYLSCVNDRPICCLEERCRGRGDAVCKMVGRPRDELDPNDPELRFYQQGGLDDDFTRLSEALRKTERQLKARRKELDRGRRGATVEAGGLLARSEPMRKVIELGRRVARVDATVLITGESGAGKEGVARLIHDESARAARPFVAINCGAVPESLLESELFGHARGAFTGASSDRPGLFEAASGGTLFLDEIGEVPPAMQVRLLRVLQEREVRRVGENRARKVDARIVAATNRDLGAEVLAGRFRQDLFYRLRVIELHVPPLRERPDDILPLARLFLQRHARLDGDARKRAGDQRAGDQRAGDQRAHATGFTTRAAQQLLRYRWPGNVRELENAIERAAVLAEGADDAKNELRIDVGDLPDEVRLARTPAHPSAAAPDPGSDKGAVRPLAAVERDYILAVLQSKGGNRARAAEALGIGPATLYRKLKEYGKGSVA